MSDVQELHEGRWRPAVPLPFYGLLHVRCHCGKRFWGRARGRYESHYRKHHIHWTDRGPCMPEVKA